MKIYFTVLSSFAVISVGAICIFGLSRVAQAQSQADMTRETNAEYQHVDNQLADLYRGIMQNLDSKSAANLRASERAWITFRDAEAKYESATYEGGTIYGTIYAGSLTELTKQRIQQLQKQLDDSGRPLMPRANRPR